MDAPTLDARLPVLYRRILDAATELEGRGQRAEALRIRRRAARHYMTWDERSERRLTGILEEASRRVGPVEGRDGIAGRVRGRLRRTATSGPTVQQTT
ncbi:MAG TPA: hypothetical protein VEY67_11455 [Candidatus Dormibacteraeota bacterium]|nr:hypothetical protein [Candidatus Dormibacteraeota bacterium]